MLSLISLLVTILPLLIFLFALTLPDYVLMTIYCIDEMSLVFIVKLR